MYQVIVKPSTRSSEVTHNPEFGLAIEAICFARQHCTEAVSILKGDAVVWANTTGFVQIQKLRPSML